MNMKKQCVLAISLMLLALCLTPAALADTDREAAARQSMENALTEVYGYLAEEAQAFTYEVTPADGCGSPRGRRTTRTGSIAAKPCRTDPA